MQDLCEAVLHSSRRNSSPHLICVAPSREGADVDAELARTLGALPGVTVIAAADILERYPVAEVFDDIAERMALIPFSSDLYLAIATMVTRTIVRMTRRPLKVIVVDGDNTLWSGVLGEDGIDGVVIDEGRRALHRYLIRQRNDGVLLCLSTKNDPDLVASFFDRRKDGVLAAADFVAIRANWLTKSENLRALSEELNLSLDSFVMLDDNPVELGEINARIPQVPACGRPRRRASCPPSSTTSGRGTQPW